jgi:crotonobetaine/carnitine-CoA ligase
MADADRTISSFFRRAVAAAPDQPWLFAGDDTFSFGAALHRVECAAGALRHAGVRRGDRVLVTARNTADYLLAWFALMEVGAVQVPVNPRSTDAELAGFVHQVRPALVIADGDITAQLPRRVMVQELFASAPDGHGPTAVDPTDVAVMIPTSGTTGRSKLVMQTHVAYVMAGEGFPYWLNLTSDDRLMTSLPLFHINAPAYSTLGSIAARAGLVLLEAFSARGFLDSARRYGATQFNAIGAMLEILMRQPPRPDDADTPLRRCYTGPAPAEARQLEMEHRFGIEITCGYGLSESPYALIWPRGARPFGTLGAPRQHPTLGHVNDARVMDGARQVARGEVGELQLRNPAIMRGYFEMPDATAAVLVDGWLRTGDLVQENVDGTYTFVGRAKDVIRRRGENLSPLEVEAALERHPDVAEAAVIGVPSDLSEEDVKAFVIAAPGRTVDVAALHRFAAEQLAPFKVPRYVEIVADMPHTPTGRLAKHKLPRDRTTREVDMEDTNATSPADGGAPAWLQSWIGSSTADRITVAGRDLPSEIMGRLTLTELAYLLVTRREATAGERRLLDTVLVSLADHGLTPSALATRLTYTGAPEATQAAIAAGLLGAGSVFLGPTGDTAEFLTAALGAPTSSSRAAGPPDDDALRQIAETAVTQRRAAGQRVPGLGHPVHREVDPRTPRLYQLAADEGLLGPHLRLLQFVAAAHEAASAKRLPINGAGAAGAALADLGLPPTSVRGFVLIARTAGLVAHLTEEAEHPIGKRLWLEVEQRAEQNSVDRQRQA